jgi:hypothetical protein
MLVSYPLDLIHVEDPWQGLHAGILGEWSEE